MNNIVKQIWKKQCYNIYYVIKLHIIMISVLLLLLFFKFNFKYNNIINIKSPKKTCLIINIFLWLNRNIILFLHEILYTFFFFYGYQNLKLQWLLNFNYYNVDSRNNACSPAKAIYFRSRFRKTIFVLIIFYFFPTLLFRYVFILFETVWFLRAFNCLPRESRLLAVRNTNDEGSFYFTRPTQTFAMIATPLIIPTAAALNWRQYIFMEYKIKIKRKITEINFA